VIQQVPAEHLGWGQAPSLDTKKYEWTIWVPLNTFGNIEGATWGVVRAFWLSNGASVRRRVRRAPREPPT